MRDGVGQGFVGRETWGWMHYMFLVAFIGLFIGTSIVFVNDDIPISAAAFRLCTIISSMVTFISLSRR